MSIPTLYAGYEVKPIWMLPKANYKNIRAWVKWTEYENWFRVHTDNRGRFIFSGYTTVVHPTHYVEHDLSTKP